MDISNMDPPKSVSPPLFENLNADITNVTQIESLCMNCYENGMTRLLLTKIPHFRDVIVSSFCCDKCGYSNNQLDSAGSIADRGVRCTLKVLCQKDLNRQVIRSSGSEVKVIEIDASFPCSEGNLSTVEGVLRSAAENLEVLQPTRRIAQPDLAAKIDEFIKKMQSLQDDLPHDLPHDLEKEQLHGFRFVLDDPSGRSWIENLHAPLSDSQLHIVHYSRTADQNEALGLNVHAQEQVTSVTTDLSAFNPKEEVIGFCVNCPNCNAPAKSNMKLLDIPFFKEVVIMATVCDVCGFRDNEVKGGAGIEPRGQRLELTLTQIEDLSRDVLKSDTCKICIPALDFDTECGTLGGRFTTVEGMLTAIRNQLGGLDCFSQVLNDGSSPDQSVRMEAFIKQLQEVIDGRRLDGSIVFILDDPAGNSYIQNLFSPNPDCYLKVITYERNEEQNELLGLNDMNTENYR